MADCPYGSEAKPGADPGAKRWRIGFSQVTTTEPWRVLFNRQMRAEADKRERGTVLVIGGGWRNWMVVGAALAYRFRLKGLGERMMNKAFGYGFRRTA